LVPRVGLREVIVQFCVTGKLEVHCHYQAIRSKC
jgi:hypothetical protein